MRLECPCMRNQCGKCSSVDRANAQGRAALCERDGAQALTMIRRGRMMMMMMRRRRRTRRNSNLSLHRHRGETCLPRVGSEVGWRARSATSGFRACGSCGGARRCEHSPQALNRKPLASRNWPSLHQLHQQLLFDTKNAHLPHRAALTP